jgi:uncharacterized membrane protein YfcA
MQDVLLFGVGLVVGIMNAIAGGGMLVGFPVLVATGLPPLVANATSPIIVLPGQLSSAFGYRKYLRKVPLRYVWLLLPCFLGGLGGAYLLRSTPHETFENLVPGLVLLGVVLFAFQPFFHRHLHFHLHGPLKHRQRLWPLFIAGFIILPLSVYGGYFGAGYGFVMLALLGFTKIRDIHQINGMKNVSVIAISTASIITLHGSGLIDWRHGLVMGVGSLLGGYCGSVFSQRFSSHTIRLAVIAIGICAVVYLFLYSQ